MDAGISSLLGPHLSAEQALARLSAETGLDMFTVREMKTSCFRLLFNITLVLNDQTNKGQESNYFFDENGLHVVRGFYEALDWMEAAPDRYQTAIHEANLNTGFGPPPGTVWDGAKFVSSSAA